MYFPGSIVSEIEDGGSPNTIPDLMQLIIRELGVPTLRRFERAVRSLWSGSKRVGSGAARPLPVMMGIPEPIPYNSSRYMFYGRKMHTRDEELRRYGMDPVEDEVQKVETDVSWPSQATLSSTSALNRAQG